MDIVSYIIGKKVGESSGGGAPKAEVISAFDFTTFLTNFSFVSTAEEVVE